MPGGSSYTNTFTGSIVEPRDVNYQALALSATPLQLFWPTSSQAAGTVCARINDVTPAGASQIVLMPPANQASNGSDALFRNIGANAFTVQDSTGATIIAVPVGISVYIYLKDNSSAGGTWGVITFGAGTSANDATSLAGLGLKSISTTLNVAFPVSDISATPAISSTSRGQLYAWQSGVGGVTLPSTVSVGADFFFLFKNNGTGNFVFTAAGTDVIDNAASISIAPNESCLIFSDGANPGKWYSVGLGRNVNFAFSLLVKNVAGNTDVTLTATEASNKLITFTGALTGNINVIVPNTASPFFIYNNTSGAFTLGVKTVAGTGVAIASGTRSILTCDAINVYLAQTNTVATTAFNPGSAGSPSVTFVGFTNTGVYLPGASQVGISGGGANVAVFDGSVGSPVNYLQFASSATGAPVIISALGTDPAVGIQLKPKGTGTVVLADSSSKAVVTALGVASAVNGLQVTNAATLNPVLIAPIGTDGNIGITITPKGTGTIILADANSKAVVTAVGVASAVNGLQITNSVTTAPVLIAPTGTDGNIGVTITPKGTGIVIVSSGLTVGGSLVLTTAVGKIVPGATSISLRNNADSADNVLITDAGAVTIRSSLSVLGSTIPQRSSSVNTTTVLADANGHLLHPVADNNPRTFTIDSNANVAYAIGTVITFVNQINVLTITITSDTMTLAGTSNTGSRTLAANGIASALKVTATSWVISGTGLA